MEQEGVSYNPFSYVGMSEFLFVLITKTIIIPVRPVILMNLSSFINFEVMYPVTFHTPISTTMIRVSEFLQTASVCC